jgi:hypothetical protein
MFCAFFPFFSPLASFPSLEATLTQVLMKAMSKVRQNFKYRHTSLCLSLLASGFQLPTDCVNYHQVHSVYKGLILGSPHQGSSSSLESSLLYNFKMKTCWLIGYQRCKSHQLQTTVCTAHQLTPKQAASGRDIH